MIIAFLVFVMLGSFFLSQYFVIDLYASEVYICYAYCILIALCCYAISLLRYRKYRLVKDTPVSKIRSAPLGPAAVSGKAFRADKNSGHILRIRNTPIPSGGSVVSFIILTGKLIIKHFHHTVLSREFYDEIADFRPFIVKSGEGNILIDPKDSYLELEKPFSEYIVDMPQGSTLYCYGTITKYDGKNKSIENFFPEGGSNPLYPDLIMKKGKFSSVFIISDKEKQQFVKTYFNQTILLFIAALCIMLYVAYAYFSQKIPADTFTNTGIPGLVPAILAVVFALFATLAFIEAR